MTPFEKRLSEIPSREIPAEWRVSVLNAARQKRPRSFFAVIRNPQSKIRNLLWPHPWAWGVLAACWLLIAGLNFSGPRGEELYAVTPKGMTPLNITPEAYAAYTALRNRFLVENQRIEPVDDLPDRRKL